MLFTCHLCRVDGEAVDTFTGRQGGYPIILIVILDFILIFDLGLFLHIWSPSIEHLIHEHAVVLHVLLTDYSGYV